LHYNDHCVGRKRDTNQVILSNMLRPWYKQVERHFPESHIVSLREWRRVEMYKSTLKNTPRTDHSPWTNLQVRTRQSEELLVNEPGAKQETTIDVVPATSADKICTADYSWLVKLRTSESKMHPKLTLSSSWSPLTSLYMGDFTIMTLYWRLWVRDFTWETSLHGRLRMWTTSLGGLY